MQTKSTQRTATSNLNVALCIAWGSQFIQIASGFIVPRLIEDRLGRELLGVWDLTWSLTSYFMLLEAGIGSAVNRHIALHLADGDMTSVNRVVSSVAAVQRVIGTLIVGLCVALSFFVGTFAKGLPASKILQAQWLVIILGSSIGISLYGAVYTGVLAGCQKWKLHHGIFAFTNTLSIIGMVAALSFGKGLITIALVHWSTEILGRSIRTVAAHKVCRGLSNRLRNANLATVRQMVSYGGKVYLTQMSQIAMNQTVNVMISAVLGPATLPIFVRPRNLVRQASFFSQKYAFMLVPRAATLSANAMKGDQSALAIESTRNGLFIALPLTALLAFSGNNLLSLWMGPDFADSLLIAILAVGFLSEIAYWPLNSILAGLNHHGRPAVASMIGALVSVTSVGALLFAGYKNLSLIALAVTVPWSIIHGIYIPLCACALLNVSMSRFILDSWKRPLLCVLPFVGCLLAANALFPDAALKALLAGGLAGGVVLVSTYWKWGSPAATKSTAWTAEPSAAERVVV